MTMSFIALHSEDGEYVKELPTDKDGIWYSSHGYGDKMLQYLKEKQDSKDERPFFAYLPFTAPHWPLQAPQEYIKKYKGVYDDGPDVLRQRRLERLKELGMISRDVEPHPVVASEVKDWSEMTKEEKARSCRAMECFAAMVECIDTNVGKIVNYLESTGELDNTFVCFMSDNGAEGAAYETYPIVQGSMLQHLQKYYNNSLDNLGNADSFIWYGPRWAQAATAPSRLYKAYTTEGGVRVPFIAKFPKDMTLPKNETVSTTGITDQFSTIMDLAPTILELAGVTHPAPLYKGREVVPMRGKSMVPFITGTTPRIHPTDFIQGWETCGRAAVRRGDWKIVFIPKPRGPERWQLYNLSKDPGEVNDLSEHSDQAHRMKEMLKLWDQYVLETGVIPLAPELGQWLEATEAQMTENVWMEYEYWKDGARDDPHAFSRHPQRFERIVKPI